MFEQVALLHPKRRLQPRTYRAPVGHTLLIGGVARIDVLQCPGATLYLTAFASSAVACHLSKSDNVSERYAGVATSDFSPRTLILLKIWHHSFLWHIALSQCGQDFKRLMGCDRHENHISV